jgi:hypothetical protein
MALIHTSGGDLVNLDHVARVRLQHDDKGRWVTRLYDAEGGTLGDAEQDVRLLTSPVVAAAPGTVAVIITICGVDPDGRPDRVKTETVPIVAWRVTGSVHDPAIELAHPVFVEEPADNQLCFISMPDGRLVNTSLNPPLPSFFADIDKAKAGVLAQAQRDWDDDRAQAREWDDDRAPPNIEVPW